MQKSMYSLILADDVVKAVDRLASMDGTSRSNYINRILAEHLSLQTPETRIASIFAGAECIRDEEWVVQLGQLPSGNILEVKSVLGVKYNPAIRYSVEVVPGGEGYRGEFKVVSRTQSFALQSKLDMFFEIWSQIEHFCVLNITGGAALRYESKTGKYKRQLVLERAGESRSDAQIGAAIGAYIRLFHKTLEVYFTAKHGVDMKTYEQILNMYKEHLQGGGIVL